jgi:hypothetical protein
MNNSRNAAKTNHARSVARIGEQYYQWAYCTGIEMMHKYGMRFVMYATLNINSRRRQVSRIMTHWRNKLAGGYLGDNAPETLKEEVKEWGRLELEERYLDAVVRANMLYDERHKSIEKELGYDR